MAGLRLLPHFTPSVVDSTKAMSSIFIDVVFFWHLRLFSWWTRKTPRDAFLETLADARCFEEWEASAYSLDEILGYDLWRQNATSKYYDYRLIYERLQAIIDAREEEDILGLVNLLRSGLVRNLGNITAPRLFNRAYAGTKLLIEDYITQVALAVEYVVTYPTSPGSGYGIALTNQAKMDVLHDTRQAFGRSALVLQGGAIFGLCHLGVVKALHLKGLLPRIISGTATGALIAALVGVHTESELLDFLTGEAIDLSAFARKSEENREREVVAEGEKHQDQPEQQPQAKSTGGISGLFSTIMRRTKRFIREGYFLDVSVLERVVRANVGDMTFEEAYTKTKRVLNITVSTTGTGGGVPNLLNYLTAPNVLIWSAALASNTTSTAGMYSPVTLMCKSDSGEILPWASAEEATFRPWTHASYSDRESPLHRIAELFNVNHFIVSQARPYIAPFLRSELHHPDPKRESKWSLTMPVMRLVVMEVQHRLHQLDSLGVLPPSIRRFLLDDTVPGASLTLVPELTAGDFIKLLENPTAESIEYWILRGERSVWPAVGALKVRCAVEVELDRGYQLVRRRKPFDPPPQMAAGLGAQSIGTASRKGSTSSLRKRGRTGSMGVNG